MTWRPLSISPYVVAAAAEKSRKSIVAAIASAIKAPCNNRTNRADTAKGLVQCLEALGKLSPQGTPLSTLMDADLVLAAVTAQFAVPGMPAKAGGSLKPSI